MPAVAYLSYSLAMPSDGTSGVPLCLPAVAQCLYACFLVSVCLVVSWHCWSCFVVLLTSWPQLQLGCVRVQHNGNPPGCFCVPLQDHFTATHQRAAAKLVLNQELVLPCGEECLLALNFTTSLT